MPEIDAPRRWGRSLVAAAILATLALSQGFARAESPPSPSPASQPKKAPPSTAIDVAAALGGIIRVGDAPVLDVAERGGPLLSVGASYVFHPIALGLHYEHARFGREEGFIGSVGAAQVTRQLNTLWAFARVRFHGLEPVVPFVQAGPGAVWQSARAGIIDFRVGGRSFSCSVGDSVNLGLRAGGGVEVPLSPSILFLGEGSFDAYRLSSEIIEGCAPGAGTSVAFTLRAGFAYRFDLSRPRAAR